MQLPFAASKTPSDADTTIRTIEYGYDDQSRVNLVSSKNSAGTVVNQVRTTFDGWGNIIKSEQELAGAVSGGTRPGRKKSDAESGAASCGNTEHRVATRDNESCKKA